MHTLPRWTLAMLLCGLTTQGHAQSPPADGHPFCFVPPDDHQSQIHCRPDGGNAMVVDLRPLQPRVQFAFDVFTAGTRRTNRNVSIERESRREVMYRFNDAVQWATPSLLVKVHSCRTPTGVPRKCSELLGFAAGPRP